MSYVMSRRGLEAVQRPFAKVPKSVQGGKDDRLILCAAMAQGEKCPEWPFGRLVQDVRQSRNPSGRSDVRGDGRRILICRRNMKHVEVIQ